MSSLNVEVRALALERGVTRLCHFTQSRNLLHILDVGRLLSTADLRARDLPINPNDQKRMDGFEDHISCSIEYPNTWFMNVAASRERLFEDWIVLLVKPAYIWDDRTMFCPVNAAKDRGSYVGSNTDGFLSMYDIGPEQSRQKRGLLHLTACPTDNQAEVLVASMIPVAHVVGIVGKSHGQVVQEQARLRLLGRDPWEFEWRASPEMFDAHRLAGRIQSGERVSEERVAPSLS